MTPRRLVVLVSLALSLAGCHRPFRAAVIRAEAAAAVGDRYGEAIAWRDACRIDPGDDRACSRAALTAHEFVASAVAAATPACAAGDPDRCGAAIRPAYDLAPADPEVLRLLDETGRLHAARCPAAAADPGVAVARLACLDGWRNAVPTAAYRGRVEGEARALAGELARRADAPGIRERPAAVHALLATAACLDPARRAAADEADRAFRGRGVPLALQVVPVAGSAPVPSAARLCEEVRAAAPIFSCGGPGEPIRLAVDVALSQPRYAVEETQRFAQVRVGTRQVPNPAWASADERARAADDRVRAAEREERRLVQRCDETRRRAMGDRGPNAHEVWSDCDRASAATRDRERVESEADDAHRALDGIRPTIDEDVYQAVPYRERLHRWTASFAARVEGPDGRPVEVTPPGGVLVHEELERPAVPDAGVRGDPFEDLPPGRFEALAAEALRGPVASFAGEALRARARAREASCGREGAEWSGPWLACRGEAAFWGGRPIEAELLRTPGADAPIPCR